MALQTKTNGRVLFVDDDPFYREMADASLADAGYTVVAAADGSAALSLLDSDSFDLVVVDLSMPGLSGFDVMDRMRTPSGQLHTPVIVITGHDDTASVDNAFDGGAMSFQAKPLNWLLFVHHVNFVLKSARAEQELRNASRMSELMGDLQTRLLGTLANEFHGPLRSAFGFATLMRQEADGPVGSPLYATWIGEIHRSLDKLMATHTRMMNFGRSLSETIQLCEENFSLPRLIMDVVADVAELASRRSIRIEHASATIAAHMIHGDPALIAQALRVPLDNAMRFSSRGSLVSIAADITDAGDLRLISRDYTPALTQAGIADILGTGQGARAQAGFNEQTTGMKLSRVLIEAHGGSLNMRAAEGEGMLTEILLPARRIIAVQPAAPAPAPAPRPAHAPSDPHGNGLSSIARGGMRRGAGADAHAPQRTSNNAATRSLDDVIRSLSSTRPMALGPGVNNR